MLILEQDVLEVIIFSFMDHLRPAISGEIQYNENKSSLSFGLTIVVAKLPLPLALPQSK